MFKCVKRQIFHTKRLQIREKSRYYLFLVKMCRFRRVRMEKIFGSLLTHVILPENHSVPTVFTEMYICFNVHNLYICSQN
jgi:hypothetical protein